MPLYEYECQSCHTHSEVSQSIHDAALTVCDKCGGPLVRLIGATSFVLKGGGWYKDLYSKKPGD